MTKITDLIFQLINIVKSIIKETNVEFNKDHIIALDEHGKALIIWKNGCISEYGFNRHKRTIEKTTSITLSSFESIQENAY